ncbi:MAG: hypothetical protein IAF38_04900, partial [Bacteroidia bacterium]|nr:hypothetical protein [Bacteroidia bacterium]
FHYLFAKNALSTPSNLLNGWAKPVFTFFAFPFAQFGVQGIHFFNVHCAVISSLLCCAVARNFGLRYAWLSPLLLVLCPVYFILLPTGLTEPFFGLHLVFCVYLFSSDKPASAAFFASFLPFSGTDGFWFLPFMIAALLYIKKPGFISLLFFGTVFYSALGFMFKGNFFFSMENWANTDDPTKSFFHYFGLIELMYGLPLEIFFLTGIFFLSRFLILKKLKKNKSEQPFSQNIIASEYILVFGFVFMYFIIRSVTLVTGTFNSIGMDREMAGITPLIILIALRGLNGAGAVFKEPVMKKVMLFVIPVFLIGMAFNFYSRRLFVPKTFKGQNKFAQAGAWFREKELRNKRVWFGNPAFIFYMGLNPGDKTNAKEILAGEPRGLMKPGEIVVWDSESCAPYQEFNVKWLQLDPEYILLKSFGNVSLSPDDKSLAIFIFQKRDTTPSQNQ